MLGNLLSALASADPLAREDAARGLDRLELSGEGAASALVEAFHEATARVAKGALAGRSLERDEQTRTPLARALQRVGPEARGAAPALVDALIRGGPELADAAVFALEAVAPEAGASLLLERLRGGELAARLAAARALRDLAFVLEPRAAYARARNDASRAPRLLRIIEERGLGALLEASAEAPLRPQILAVLGYLGPTGDASLAALSSALTAPDEPSRRAAAVALGYWGAGAAPALGSLASLLGGPLSAAAAASLGRMGAAARGALAELERSLPLLDPASREAAGRAIDRIRDEELPAASLTARGGDGGRPAAPPTPTPPPVARVVPVVQTLATPSLASSLERPFGKLSKPASKAPGKASGKPASKASGKAPGQAPGKAPGKKPRR
jgi:hypothetical protein